MEADNEDIEKKTLSFATQAMRSIRLDQKNRDEVIQREIRSSRNDLYQEITHLRRQQGMGIEKIKVNFIGSGLPETFETFLDRLMGQEMSHLHKTEAAKVNTTLAGKATPNMLGEFLRNLKGIESKKEFLRIWVAQEGKKNRNITKEDGLALINDLLGLECSFGPQEETGFRKRIQSMQNEWELAFSDESIYQKRQAVPAVSIEPEPADVEPYPNETLPEKPMDLWRLLDSRGLLSPPDCPSSCSKVGLLRFNNERMESLGDTSSLSYDDSVPDLYFNDIGAGAHTDLTSLACSDQPCLNLSQDCSFSISQPDTNSNCQNEYTAKLSEYSLSDPEFKNNESDPASLPDSISLPVDSNTLGKPRFPVRSHSEPLYALPHPPQTFPNALRRDSSSTPSIESSNDTHDQSSTQREQKYQDLSRTFLTSPKKSTLPKRGTPNSRTPTPLKPHVADWKSQGLLNAVLNFGTPDLSRRGKTRSSLGTPLSPPETLKKYQNVDPSPGKSYIPSPVIAVLKKRGYWFQEDDSDYESDEDDSQTKVKDASLSLKTVFLSPRAPELAQIL